MARNEPVTVEHSDQITLISIDSPPVNALSVPVVDGIDAAVAAVEKDSAVRAVVVYAHGQTFVAGGDISEFSQPGFDSFRMNRALDRLEALEVPVIAAIHGTALGGGLELAMACHYRVAVPSARVGLPEVTLGLLPGAGGTQRLPRLVGVARALDMILSGAPVDAARACELGVIDTVTEDDPRAAGLAFARALIDDGALPRRTSALEARTGPDAEEALDRAREQASGRKAPYPAWSRIIECVQASASLPFDEGLTLENRLFEECRLSPESEAMRHVFFAERKARKVPDLPAQTRPVEVQRVGVIGAGTMGSGITISLADHGLVATLVEQDTAALDRGLERIRKVYEAAVKKGRMAAREADTRLARISGTLDYADIGDCDLVIEAVYESLVLKKEVSARLGEVCRPETIIATNTSTLDVDVIAQASCRPEKVVGMHFFSPAHVMRLLEVVRGRLTDPVTLATAIALGTRIGKAPVVSGVCYGFIGNRMIEPYMREAEFMLMEGASPAQVDEAIQSLGLPMGPCRMLDMAGIDVGAKTVLENRAAGGLPPDGAYRAVVLEMNERGWHGQKSGAGYYRYEGRKPLPNPDIEALCEELRDRHGIERRGDISNEEIVERCLYTLINEGALILDEGIAMRPGDIDIVFVYGYGFPDYRGGPMYMADCVGTARIVSRLEYYAATRGNRYGYWDVAEYLQRLAAEGRGFSG